MHLASLAQPEKSATMFFLGVIPILIYCISRTDGFSRDHSNSHSCTLHLSPARKVSHDALSWGHSNSHSCSFASLPPGRKLSHDGFSRGHSNSHLLHLSHRWFFSGSFQFSFIASLASARQFSHDVFSRGHSNSHFGTLHLPHSQKCRHNGFSRGHSNSHLLHLSHQVSCSCLFFRKGVGLSCVSSFSQRVQLVVSCSWLLLMFLFSANRFAFRGPAGERTCRTSGRSAWPPACGTPARRGPRGVLRSQLFQVDWWLGGERKPSFFGHQPKKRRGR